MSINDKVHVANELITSTNLNKINTDANDQINPLLFSMVGGSGNQDSNTKTTSTSLVPLIKNKIYLPKFIVNVEIQIEAEMDGVSGPDGANIQFDVGVSASDSIAVTFNGDRELLSKTISVTGETKESLLNLVISATIVAASGTVWLYSATIWGKNT